MSTSNRTDYAAAAQRRNINRPALQCREGAPQEHEVRFSGRHELIGDQTLPNTDLVAEHVIQLPFFNELTQGQIREVCEALKHAIQDARRNT